MSKADSRALLRQIGVAARPAGSAAESRARNLCAAWLLDAGFVVQERPFEYSALPGRWGTPIAGLTLLLTALVAGAGIARGPATSDRTLAGALLALTVVALAGWWTGRYGTRLLPFMRRQGVNLEARRGTPTVWLTAHLDSKSQPFSLLARAAAAVVVAVSWLCVLIAWGVSLVVAVPNGFLLVLVGCAAVAAVPLVGSWVGIQGDGALDNASGVVSILGAVSLLDPAAPVGVVITSAEEFGLAGARAWVEDVPVSVTINCDGVDDRGSLTITSGPVGRDLWRASGVLGADVRIRRNLPGVLLDSTAFSDRGWTACTVSQGTPASLARVHTARDTLAELSGRGIERVSGVIAALAGAIIASSSGPECQKRGSRNTWNDKD